MYKTLVLKPLFWCGETILNNSVKTFGKRCKSWKKHLDFSLVPKLDEADLEEQNVKGSGPGGQSVNKSNNCVILKHKPTNIIVKCHETRSLMENKKKAREILISKLDSLINGENSIESQEERIKQKKSAQKKRKQRILNEKKKAFQQMLKNEGNLT